MKNKIHLRIASKSIKYLGKFNKRYPRPDIKNYNTVLKFKTK